MINRLQLLRNVGQFDSVSSGASMDLAKLTLIYAENGRGKTTLSAILRSLATGEAMPIAERHRLGASHPPEVIIACSGGAQPARFQNGAWTRTCPDMIVFDDLFVDRNVYSGLEVEAEHRQNLHELILGEQGVALVGRVAELAEQIRAHNTDLRAKTAALQSIERQRLTIDDFCALPASDDVDDAIATAEKLWASIMQADAVRATDLFSSLTLPVIDVSTIRTLLAKTIADVQAEALSAVRAHFAFLGEGAESWVSTGVDLASSLSKHGKDKCPFCVQPLSNSTMFTAYPAYFGDAYKKHLAEIVTTFDQVENTLKGDALAGFERQIQTARTRRSFWVPFCIVPDIGIDSTELAAVWQQARNGLLAALAAKKSDPLQRLMLDTATESALTSFGLAAHAVASVSVALGRANEDIERVKEASKSGNAAAAQGELRRLKAIKERYSPATATACADYMQVKGAKAKAEAAKAAAQTALGSHRTTVLPLYQSAINKYLVLFNAGFSIEKVEPHDAAGTPSCTFQLGINTHLVPVASRSGAAFKNTLSAGDRNTLALAFFFASLDRDPHKGDKVVVLDDPVSSLDEHRTLATVQEARKLAQHVSQVIVLSHSKPFLARIWQHADPKHAAALEVSRDTVGSTIAVWNVNDENVTEYDRRHARLRDYRESNTGKVRDVAEAIRPLLEGYLRVACAADFRPGTLLGPFRQVAKDRSAAGKPILDAQKLMELENLTEYGNRFHHDTNPSWDTEHINDGELKGYVLRTLAFVGA